MNKIRNNNLIRQSMTYKIASFLVKPGLADLGICFYKMIHNKLHNLDLELVNYLRSSTERIKHDIVNNSHSVSEIVELSKYKVERSIY